MDQNASPSVAVICDAIGRAVIAKAVGRGITAVSNAVTEGRFPASWYVAVKSLCEERSLACPEELFSFIDMQAVITAVGETSEGANA